MLLDVCAHLLAGPGGKRTEFDNLIGFVPTDDLCKGTRRGLIPANRGNPGFFVCQIIPQRGHLPQMTALVRVACPECLPKPEGLPFERETAVDFRKLETQSFSKKSGTGAVIDTAFAPDLLSYYYVTTQGATEKPNVWRLEALTGVSTKALTNPFNPSAVVIGRFGDLYTIEGSDIVRYDTTTLPATPIGSNTISPAPDAISYDDKNDTVVVLTEKPTNGPRHIITLPRILSGFGTNRTLLETVTGNGYIAPDAETAGAYWVCGDVSSILYSVEYSSVAGGFVKTDPTLYPSYPDCYADCDSSGSLDLFDFLCFTNAFNVNSFVADCDHDSAYTLFDFLCFTNAFNAGCP